MDDLTIRWGDRHRRAALSDLMTELIVPLAHQAEESRAVLDRYRNLI